MKNYLIPTLLLVFLPFSSSALDSLNVQLLEFAKAYQTESYTVPDIVAYLSTATENENQLAEIIFYWISQNIEYDYGMMKNMFFRPKDYDPLAERKGVCHDYAVLFEKMCTEAGLECYYVSGFAKPLDYKEGTPFKRCNHAWNVVKVENNFTFVDATWGSGYCIGYDYFKKIDLSYVLVDTVAFTEKHLPEDPIWQLSDHPVSYENFIANKSYKDMQKQLETSYEYFKKIEQNKKADYFKKKVLEAKRIYNFRKTKDNAAMVAYAYTKVGEDILLKEYKNPSKVLLNEAEIYFNRSISIYKKIDKGRGYKDYIKWAENSLLIIKGRRQRL